MSYQPSDQVKRVQKLLEVFEEKKDKAERARAQVLSKDISFQAEYKRVEEDRDRRKKEATEAFEALMEKIEHDAFIAVRVIEDEADALKEGLHKENVAVSQVKAQLAAELKKMGAQVEIRQVDPIEVEPFSDVASQTGSR